MKTPEQLQALEIAQLKSRITALEARLALFSHAVEKAIGDLSERSASYAELQSGRIMHLQEQQ